MTKEELKKEAGEYAEKHAFRVPYDGLPHLAHAVCNCLFLMWFDK